MSGRDYVHSGAVSTTHGFASEGRLLPNGTGSRVTVTGHFGPEGPRFAWDVAWDIPIGILLILLGFADPGSQVPALVVGSVFLLGVRAYRWRLVNATHRTRQALTSVLTGPPPPPAKWRPRLPTHRSCL